MKSRRLQIQEGFTLKQISAASGVQPRTLQFWTSERILLPKPSTHLRGPGTNRRYPKCEVQIAALLGEVKALGVQVGTLQAISLYLRETLLADQEFGFEDIDAAQAALDDDRWKPRFGMVERLRVIKWILIQEAIHYKTKTMLGLTINEEGCTAVIFTLQPETKKMKKAIDSLSNRGAKILISIAPVLYDVECNLDPDFQRYQ